MKIYDNLQWRPYKVKTPKTVEAKAKALVSKAMAKAKAKV